MTTPKQQAKLTYRMCREEGLSPIESCAEAQKTYDEAMRSEYKRGFKQPDRIDQRL